MLGVDWSGGKYSTDISSSSILVLDGGGWGGGGRRQMPSTLHKELSAVCFPRNI